MVTGLTQKGGAPFVRVSRVAWSKMSPSDWQILIPDSSTLVALGSPCPGGNYSPCPCCRRKRSVEVWEPLSERPLRGVNVGPEIAAGDSGYYLPVSFSMEPR